LTSDKYPKEHDPFYLQESLTMLTQTSQALRIAVSQFWTWRTAQRKDVNFYPREN